MATFGSVERANKGMTLWTFEAMKPVLVLSLHHQKLAACTLRDRIVCSSGIDEAKTTCKIRITHSASRPSLIQEVDGAGGVNGFDLWRLYQRRDQ